jgi:hypothetical protein
VALAAERNVDSELRFYGVWYAASGLAMHKAAADVEADRLLHPLLAAGWLAASLSRLLSIRAVGRPDALFMMLGAAEAVVGTILVRAPDAR